MAYPRRLLATGCFLLLVAPARAITLDEPGSYAVEHTWAGAGLGIPAPLGGLLFSTDGSTLYVVGDSEEGGSALYAVPVTRDPVTHAVTDLGPAGSVTRVFAGTERGLDAGWDIGPAGTLFYTYWSANYLGQRPGGVGGAETLFDMSVAGVPSSVAGLTFSPHVTDPGTGFGQMQISTWSSGGQRDLFDIPLAPVGGGIFTPTGHVLFARLPREGTGALQYVPSGPLAGDLMYVNWDYGEIRVLAIDDATGLPIDAGTSLPARGTANPVDTRFAHDLGVGPWGLEFDPLTNDFFVGTWQGTPANSIIHIAGPGFPPPPATTTTTTTLPSLEVCGNCRDDDNNGLVDFEDPACCGAGEPVRLTLQRARFAPRPRGGGTRAALRARVVGLGMPRPLVAEDVFVQVRAGAAALCASIPSARLTVGKRGLRFKDPRGSVASAAGLARMKLAVRKNGQVRMAASGARTSLGIVPAGPLSVAWAVRAPGAGAARCAGATATLRASRKGAVRYP